jgi:hypothetical protein
MVIGKHSGRMGSREDSTYSELLGNMCDSFLNLHLALVSLLNCKAKLLELHQMSAKKYLLHFAVAHDDFRLPELSSVSQLFNFEIGLPDDVKDCNPKRPFTIVTLESDEHARLLVRRCIMIKLVLYLRALRLRLRLC